MYLINIIYIYKKITELQQIIIYSTEEQSGQVKPFHESMEAFGHSKWLNLSLEN